MRVAQVLIALLLMFGGCPATKVYKEGAAYEESGNEFAAANKYLSALDLKSTHKKAKEGLLAVAEKAYEEKLGLATRQEGTGNYAGALSEYRELDQYLGRLKKFDALSFSTVDTRSKIAEMESSAAEERYVTAEALLGKSDYLGAIDAYRAAQTFKQAYKDTDEKIASAYYGLADKELTGKQYRKAAEHFAECLTTGGQGYRDAAKRGGSIYLALGTHFLESDRCRQAVRDLRIASNLLGATVSERLASAEECAVTPVAVMPFENPTGVNPAGMALGDTVADQVLSAVKAKASEFVHIVDRTALEQILSEQGLTGGSPKGLRGVRYLVTGKLTQVFVEEPKMTQSVQTAEGRQRFACTKTNNKGESYQSECLQDVLVKYVDHQGSSSVKLVASVKLIDVKTGEQLAAPTVTAEVGDRIHYADTFKGPAGEDIVPVPYNRAGGMEVKSDAVLALTDAPRELKPVSTLATGAVDKLAFDLAAAVVTQVDKEQPASDPSTLAVALAE